MTKLQSILLFFLFLGTSQLNAQAPFKQRGDRSGIFSLGVRSTFSLFGDESKQVGTGLGGQFRLQVIDRVNTDWFADYITTDLSGVAHRTDFHIGWSVMCYPWLSKKKDRFEPVLPYIAAGHCFDYTIVVENRNRDNIGRRFSAAVHMGAGVHFNITQHLDLTLNVLYMIHFGKDVHADINGNAVVISKENTGKVEGHMLPTISMSYKLVDIWGKRAK